MQTTSVVTVAGIAFLRHYWPEFDFVKYEILSPPYRRRIGHPLRYDGKQYPKPPQNLYERKN